MNPTIYVVVCSEFHGAYGPFLRPDMAAQYARRLTDESQTGCVYIPVEVKFPPGFARPDARPVDNVDSRGRGYL